MTRGRAYTHITIILFDYDDIIYMYVCMYVYGGPCTRTRSGWYFLIEKRPEICHGRKTRYTRDVHGRRRKSENIHVASLYHMDLFN